jgi:hypothetical protein
MQKEESSDLGGLIESVRKLVEELVELEQELRSLASRESGDRVQAEAGG